MAQAAAETAKRAWLKAAEVCDLAQVQPYVLRTWEIEFVDLGVARTPGGPRMYRRADVNRVLRIKQLVFGDGLTLAGARRRLEEERSTSVGADDHLPFDDDLAAPLVSQDARNRIASVKQELRALLTLLSQPRGNGHAVSAPAMATPATVSAATVAGASRSDATAAPATARKKSARRKSA
jgi:DNA-binding transcriptional MerR regulator